MNLIKFLDGRVEVGLSFCFMFGRFDVFFRVGCLFRVRFYKGRCVGFSYVDFSFRFSRVLRNRELFLSWKEE